MHPTVLACELGSPEIAANFKDSSIRKSSVILVFGINVINGVWLFLSGALDFDRSGVVEAKGPHCNIHMMTNPVQQLPTAKGIRPPPVPGVQDGVIGLRSGWSTIARPIQVSRWLTDPHSPLSLGREKALPPSAGRAAFETMHVTQNTLLNQCLETTERTRRALPATGLVLRKFFKFTPPR